MKKKISEETRQKLRAASHKRWEEKRRVEAAAHRASLGRASSDTKALNSALSAPAKRRTDSELAAAIDRGIDTVNTALDAVDKKTRADSVAPTAAWHVGDTASTIVRDLPNGQTFIVPEGFRIETISLSNNGALTRFTIATA